MGKGMPIARILILYESKTGYTKKYAQWAAEELSADIFPFRECTDEMLNRAELVIYGGGVNGSIINSQKKFERKLRKYPDKTVVYFAAGIRPATERTNELILKNNFGTQEVTFFYFRGGLQYEKTSPGDKTLIRIYCAMMKRRRELHEEDREVLKLMCQDGDYSSRDQIQPLVTAVREMFCQS